MKISTSKLAGLELDWAVAKAEYGLTSVGSFLDGVVAHPNYSMYLPSLNWSQGGPIIERERISIRPDTTTPDYRAFVIRPPEGLHHRYIGATPLVAAMRCYVATKLGEEVEVPENLFSEL